MDDPPALELRSVSKRYRLRDGGEFAAVDSLSLEVRRGEIVALLGPNGAGKTTAMQLALGLLHADAGEARLFGGDPELLATRRRIGYGPDAPLFPKELTGLEVLTLHGELLGFHHGDAKDRAIRFATEVGLAEPSRRRIATYSRGQQQRLGVALALLGDPDLLLLDEPTAGLDPAGVAAMREMERVCDRVLFLKGGRLLRTHEMRATGLRAEIRLANASELLARVPQMFASGLDGNRLRLEIPGEDAVPPLVRKLVEAGAEIVEVRLIGADLEQLYLEIVEGRT